ncbi:DUF4179 domain-containing protein [Brevibacillus sp. AY1]|uniref:DUF4179 domain-containing protein n=1 Tax=Brevibacillus sp. AY1 TaxID=2807621 RepID=UPI000AA786EE|nr:DUF4179 domain-containing protein [Brevibacillus sp. AY1]MDH4615729.1 hypothetical protein [Brevibacillus sp. AY1]
MTASALLVGFFFSIRLSPVVAAYVSHIPGMEKLVDLIRDDKGLQRATESFSTPLNTNSRTMFCRWTK